MIAQVVNLSVYVTAYLYLFVYLFITKYIGICVLKNKSSRPSNEKYYKSKQKKSNCLLMCLSRTLYSY